MAKDNPLSFLHVSKPEIDLPAGTDLYSPAVYAKGKENFDQLIGQGALARPDDIRFTEMLPKTRSGKIMRRLLRELATSGDVKGDTTTLEDFSVIARLKESEEV